MSEQQEPRFYRCRVCGFSPYNRGSWCDLGCGSDYNEMIRLKPREVEALLKWRLAASPLKEEPA